MNFLFLINFASQLARGGERYAKKSFNVTEGRTASRPRELLLMLLEERLERFNGDENANLDNLSKLLAPFFLAVGGEFSGLLTFSFCCIDINELDFGVTSATKLPDFSLFFVSLITSKVELLENIEVTDFDTFDGVASL